MRQRKPRGILLRDRGRASLFYLFVFSFAASVFLLPSSTVFAQRQTGAFGTGVQIGRPGGVALKLYRPSPIVYDAIISTDGDDYVTASMHRLWERPLSESPLHYYVGPGVIIGAEGLPDAHRLRLGLSTEVGLNFYAERFEVFLHVTPTLRFLPDAWVGIDGNVGLRYYFGAQ